MEALIGIEPMNQSFADSCLTTWLKRHYISMHNNILDIASIFILKFYTIVHVFVNIKLEKKSNIN